MGIDCKVSRRFIIGFSKFQVRCQLSQTDNMHIETGGSLKVEILI